MIRRFFCSLLLLATTAAATPLTIGPGFQINVYTTSSQFDPAVVADAGGDFVVVWSSFGSYGTDSSDASVQARHLDSTGAPLGDELQVNTYTTQSQYAPALAVGADGSFLVVWHSYGSGGSDTSFTSVQGQRFDAAGAPLGDEFQINTQTTGLQRNPAVTAVAGGGFVVVWDSTHNASYSIEGQRFDTDGVPVGGEFQVDTFSASVQQYPALAADDEGGFVVVWDSLGSAGTDSSSWSIQGRRFDSAGAPAGDQFQVNTYTTSEQRRPAVAAVAGGDFVVVWSSYGDGGTDASADSIQARRYDSAGAAVGDQFQVNTYTPGVQTWPTVAAAAGGDFIVAWQSFGSAGTDSSSWSVQAQALDPAGAFVGDQFQVNDYTTSQQTAPAVGAVAGGELMVTWQSLGSGGTDSSYFSIQGRRFAMAKIFADGFESGDTAAW